MRYTVSWHPLALDELARIWTRVPDRRAVTEAADRIDQELSNDPEKKGQEFNGERLCVAPPLAVTFTIYSDDRIVQVLQVRHR